MEGILAPKHVENRMEEKSFVYWVLGAGGTGGSRDINMPEGWEVFFGFLQLAERISYVAEESELKYIQCRRNHFTPVRRLLPAGAPEGRGKVLSCELFQV